ncbi:MAG: hypothetical protein JXA69_18605 [Phycisphaerae bacterium]|nr:hypothetical protein [Phycisphaerae bacterium]
MPSPDESWDDEAWSDEADDEGLGTDESDVEAYTLPCPACGAMVYEDADKCPHCGEWITPVGEAARRSRTWRWPLLVVLLILVLLIVYHGLGW